MGPLRVILARNTNRTAVVDVNRQAKFDEFMEQFARLLPEDLRRYGSELENNVRAALQGAFSRMDLVTREEFDVQSALLSRTRALLEDLEKQVRQLEQKLEQKPR